jgi:hypothetical protein
MWVSIHNWFQVDAPVLRLRGAALDVGHGGRQGSHSLSPRGSGTAGMGSMQCTRCLENQAGTEDSKQQHQSLAFYTLAVIQSMRVVAQTWAATSATGLSFSVQNILVC